MIVYFVFYEGGWKEMIGFIIGLMIGGFVGVAIMCMLQINRDLD